MAEPTRHTFGPVVLAGIGMAALTAVAASRSWLGVTGDAAGLTVTTSIRGSDAAPLALALALVALAAWGVVLVAGRRSRRVAIVLGLLAALGVAAVVVAMGPGAHDTAVRTLRDSGATSISTLTRKPWYWLTGFGALAQVVALVAAYRYAPGWPTMSSRYDAPAGRSEPIERPEDLGDLALWKALDQGHDPTEPPAL